MNNTQDLPVEKSEIIFLYESTYSVPNGDPFTGEQRYDEETKKALVSDVRIKRFIRDYIADIDRNSVYVLNDRSSVEKNAKGDAESGAAARFNALKKIAENKDTLAILKSLTDVRLFGGILTQEKNAVNLTGPVQFALLNPSLNAVELRMHQNTSVFASSTDKERGAIGTTTVVPYVVNQIHGWINPFSARHTGLTEDDIRLMFQALWESINNANTRTKSNQNSLLLLQIIYSGATKKIYGVDRSITIKSDKKDEQLRSFDDYTLDFSLLLELTQSPLVKAVNFYTEAPNLFEQLVALPKFNAMTFLKTEG